VAGGGIELIDLKFSDLHGKWQAPQPIAPDLLDDRQLQRPASPRMALRSGLEVDPRI